MIYSFFIKRDEQSHRRLCSIVAVVSSALLLFVVSRVVSPRRLPPSSSSSFPFFPWLSPPPPPPSRLAPPPSRLPPPPSPPPRLAPLLLLSRGFQPLRWSRSWSAFPPNSVVEVLGCRLISPLVVVVVSPLLLLLLLLFLVVSPPLLLVISSSLFPSFISLLVSPILLISPPRFSCFSWFPLPLPPRFPFPLPVVSLLRVISPHHHLVVVSPACCRIMDSEHEPRQTSWLVFRNSTGASHFMGPPSTSSFPGSSVERG